MLGGEAITDGLRRSAREMLEAKARPGGRRSRARCAGESERRKRKSKAEYGERSRRHKLATKYLIETFGCQMNVHDSERMAGLLEQAGFEATEDAADADVVVINTCSVRERAEEKLYTRFGELRQLAAEQGHDPIVAVAGCVAQQEGEAIAWRVAGRGRRRRRHAGDPPPADAGRRRRSATRGRGMQSTSDPYDDVSLPLGVTRRADPVKAYVTIIEGCNEFCSFCVVPYTRGHERMRPKADILAEVREAAASRPPRGAAAGADRESLRRSRRSGVRFQRPCSKPFTRSTGSSGSGLPVRIPGTSRRSVSGYDGAAAQGLPASASAGAIGIDPRAGGDAAPLYARELPRSGRAIRDALPDVPLSTDMIVGFPGRPRPTSRRRCR